MLMNLSRLLAQATEAVSVVTNETASAAADTAAEGASMGAGGMLSMLLPFGLVLVLMYFMMIRPQRKKDKQVKDMLANLKVGDKICTIGGLYGTIAGLRDDTVTLTLGSMQNKVVIARWAIRSVENITLENDATPEV